jgi:hypothetical protein
MTALMAMPGPTQEEYDSLICKLATLETENRNYQKLLAAPAKRPGWWRCNGKKEG